MLLRYLLEELDIQKKKINEINGNNNLSEIKAFIKIYGIDKRNAME